MARGALPRRAAPARGRFAAARGRHLRRCEPAGERLPGGGVAPPGLMAAGEVDAAAGLLLQLWPPTYAQGRITTLDRWVRWLEERGGIEGHPMLPVLASLMAIVTGRPADADHWADVVDRRQRGDGHPDDPAAAAWAYLLRADLCRHGVEQMRADSGEAVRR